MWELIFLLFTELLVISIFAVYDYKHLTVPKQTGYYGIIAILLSYMFFFFFNYSTAIVLIIFGCVLYFALYSMSFFNPVAIFDKIIFFLSFITLPFITLFALLIQQAFIIVLLKTKGHPIKVPILTTFAPSMIISTLIILSTVGLQAYI